eukprot:731165-Pyramimonas_sp.AAC.1
MFVLIVLLTCAVSRNLGRHALPAWRPPQALDPAYWKHTKEYAGSSLLLPLCPVLVSSRAKSGAILCYIVGTASLPPTSPFQMIPKRAQDGQRRCTITTGQLKHRSQYLKRRRPGKTQTCVGEQARRRLRRNLCSGLVGDTRATKQPTTLVVVMLVVVVV